MTLNEIWFRILETFAGGTAYLAIAAVFLTIALQRQSLRRGLALMLGAVWAVIGLGGLVTSWALWAQHPVDIAFANALPCAAKMWLGFTVTVNYPWIVYAWKLVFQVHRAMDGKLDGLDVAGVGVRVRSRGTLLNRLRRRRESDASARNLVG